MSQDLKTLAQEMAGNWRSFNNFYWDRSSELVNAHNWTIVNTSNRDSGLLEQSNQAEITKRLKPFSKGKHPTVFFENHRHFAFGFANCVCIRVFSSSGFITKAFREFFNIQQNMESYPILNESAYSELVYNSTLANYRWEIGSKELPKDWEADVYRLFCDNNQEDCIENRDDQGGWASEQKILDALKTLNYLNKNGEPNVTSI